ncbi:very short patch repair endonuclease [uncultured Neptuniibacter sp.]|uniref:very short patch repair endonuclease n=1 Tax=uncultured Neptuniibacter sp. TaxID=502143 RepID=UPI0026132BE5|nr:DNA mismatch endonuclease Vsr [uncultured Neptuniibacter sp.]
MVDVHEKAIRSKNMSAIRSKDTKPEIWLRKQLHARGYRYRLNHPHLPGKPDLVFNKFKSVIFVNGCFWHMHSCPLFKVPKTRTDWWLQKLSKNKERDQESIKQLEQDGWKVLTVWECAIKKSQKNNGADLLALITHWIENETTSKSIPSS